jgi:ABC-2 type transport system ATP-binding protein
MHHPKVLFLDEPTIGLDPQTRNHIWDYIHRLRQEGAITIFLTTHYMDEAEHCDRVAIIDYGSIVALDTPAHLKEQVGGDMDDVFIKLTGHQMRDEPATELDYLRGVARKFQAMR